MSEELPVIGTGHLNTADEAVQCFKFGHRRLMLWAAEIDKGENTLDLALQKLRKDCEIEAERVNIPVDQLCTTTAKLTPW